MDEENPLTENEAERYIVEENIIIEDLRNFLVGFGLIELKTFALTNNFNQYKIEKLIKQSNLVF